MTCELRSDGSLSIATSRGEKFHGTPVNPPRELVDTSRDAFAAYVRDKTQRRKRFYGMLRNTVGDEVEVAMDFVQEDPASNLCQAVLVFGRNTKRRVATAWYEGHFHVDDSDHVNGWCIVLRKIRVLGNVPRSGIFNARMRKSELRMRMAMDGSGNLYAAAPGIDAPGDRLRGMNQEAVERITFEPVGRRSAETVTDPADTDEQREAKAQAALDRARWYEKKELVELALKYYERAATEFADLPHGRKAAELLAEMRDRLGLPEHDDNEL